MQLFKKRESIVQNIAYMAIMAAINVIFVLLTAVFPPLMFTIIFVLPLTSAVVTLFCKKRYFPIYFVATIALCLITTFGIYIYDTFFYVLPSLITGFVFGILIEKRMPSIYLITISIIVQYTITYLTFIILDLIFPELNFIDVLLNIFGLASFQFKDVFAHCFLYFLAAGQTILTYAFLKQEVVKLGFTFNLEIKRKYISFIVILTSLALSVAMMFIYQPLTYIFIFITFPLALFEIVGLITARNKIIYVLLVVYFFASIFIFAICYQLINKPLAVILVTPLILLTSSTYFVYNLFSNKQKSM